MRRDVARQFIGVMNRMDGLFTELHFLLFEIDDLDERREFARALFSVAIDSYEKITRPIVHEYPEMHPDKEIGPDGTLQWKKVEGGA